MSNLNRYEKVGVATIFLLAAIPAFASAASESSGSPAISFERVWSLVQKSAPSLQAAAHESEAARIGADRASHHWYPRVYVTGRAFSTNDPGTSLMYSLGQHQVGAADFAPATLNQPGSSFFEQGTLGLDLPVYEGGASVAQYHAAKKGAEAKAWEAKAKALSEFARAAEDYAGLLALYEERTQLGALRESVTAVLDRYSIGSKSNPVGYSGLLGLKNLRNRIDGLLAENEAKSQSRRSDLQALASELPDSWQPEAHRAKEFLNHVFPRNSRQVSPQGTDLAPAPVEAARLGAESLDQAKDGEKAKFLPRLGLFAQGDLYGGNRAAATSYSSGAYLRWDLFSAPNFGAIGQAEHQAAAAQARADELQHKLKSDQVAADSGAKASEKSLTLLDESAELLNEQTQTARGLFRSGSINALQLVEVLNRRADLLVSRTQAELQLAQMKAALFFTSARSVSSQAGSTESKGGVQ